jgi:hypothetical protein
MTVLMTHFLPLSPTTLNFSAIYLIWKFPKRLKLVITQDGDPLLISIHGDFWQEIG